MDTLILLVRILDFEEFRISFTFTIFVIFISFMLFLKAREHKLNEPNKGSSRNISSRWKDDSVRALFLVE